MSADLITKYRPSHWDHFIGNDAVVKALMDATDLGLAHQFLLLGESGMGKTTAARIMAREFGDDDPFEFDAATNTSVDDTRPIIESLKYKAPLTSSKKVFIMDECHMLSKSAWNSLLKSIEEPPDYAYWILCTTDATKVPPTVKTRCVVAHFKPINNDDLFHILADITRREEFPTPENIVSICAEQAGGSPRQAIANLAKCWNVTDAKDAYSLLQGAGEDSTAVDLVKALLAGASWEQLMAIVAKLDTDAESARRVMLAYLTKVALGTKGDAAAKVVRLMNIFASPCLNNGLADIVLACGVLQFTGA